MFWRIDYVIAEQSFWVERSCVIVADSKEKALELFRTEVVSKLCEGRTVVDKYIKVTECENSVVLYAGQRF